MSFRTKTDSLTLRIDPRFRFALEVLSRMRGQKLTAVVERTVLAQAAMLRSEGVDWPSLWHPVEAVRMLRLARTPELHPTFEEESRAAFCQTWWPFFYLDRQATSEHEARLSCLWPAVDDFVQLFEQTRSTDFFSVARRMTEALTSAGLKGPEEHLIKEVGQ